MNNNNEIILCNIYDCLVDIREKLPNPSPSETEAEKEGTNDVLYNFRALVIQTYEEGRFEMNDGLVKLFTKFYGSGSLPVYESPQSTPTDQNMQTRHLLPD